MKSKGTISMNKRYHDGLRIFKSRCTDYEEISNFIKGVFLNDISDIKTYFSEKQGARVCDIGCGDGTITFQLITNMLNVTKGKIFLDIIEPVGECLSLTTQKLSILNHAKLTINCFQQKVEDYLANIKIKSDLIFSSHSIYFISMGTITKIWQMLDQNGYFMVVAMSKSSVMAKLKDMFSEKPTITADDILEMMQNKGFDFSQPTMPFSCPSILNLDGINPVSDKNNLSEETKNLLSLMIQKNIDDLDNAQYKTVRDVILNAVNNNKLLLDNTSLILKKC